MPVAKPAGAVGAAIAVIGAYRARSAWRSRASASRSNFTAQDVNVSRSRFNDTCAASSRVRRAALHLSRAAAANPSAGTGSIGLGTIAKSLQQSPPARCSIGDRRWCQKGGHFGSALVRFHALASASVDGARRPLRGHLAFRSVPMQRHDWFAVVPLNRQPARAAPVFLGA